MALRILLPILILFGLLRAEEPFRLYKFHGEKPGPTLLVFGGIHGNEPGGYYAPSLLATHYRIKKGNLWVIPDLNLESIMRFQRGIHGDMNRKFAGMKPNDPDKKIVERIKKLINHPQVDLILNLHDGHGYYRRRWENSIFNPKAWGQACIIDQKCIDKARFGNLDKLAKGVSQRLNRNLMADHHIFNVKNTMTKEKDAQMRRSLTYYAITHGKPAMAIETSKNITSVPMKVFYQLRAIEAFMDEIGIVYSRDFDMNVDTIRKLLNHYGTVVLNGNFLIDLDHVDPLLRNVPMKKRGNRITFSDSPLAGLKKNGRHYDLMIGDKKIVTLYPQRFAMLPHPRTLIVEVDGRRKKIPVPSHFNFKKRFKILAPNSYRVNVIGFTKRGHRNENRLTVTRKNLDPKYAMDKENRRYRVELYQNGKFRGMVVAIEEKQ